MLRTRSRFIHSSLLAGALLLTTPIAAQMGDEKDAPGTVQQEVWKEIEVPPAPVLSPEEALATLKAPKGFKIELVAAEPLVNDPVAIAWDADGRLWAAEMWAFMPDVDGTGEEEGPALGRVVVMEDLDDDGTMDRSTVFLEGLRMPRAISFVEGGVLIGDPPNLLYCQDTDGDLKSDKSVVIGPYATDGSIEHTENGLMRAMDNWIYNAKSDRRFKFAAGKLTEEQTYFRGQWGITMDSYGRLYYNNNSNWLHSDYYPSEYVTNNPGYEPRAGLSQNVTRDMRVFTHRINPGVNRGYLDGVLREDYRLATVTAACGPTIYRGGKFPAEYSGNAFIPEPAGNVVGRYRLLEQGLAVHGQKATQPHEQWGQVEFLGSTDERFRPVNAATGPDGNLHIVDMYRGIVQHKIFVTTFLRKQILERGLDEPVGHGRIYRLVHESAAGKGAKPKMSSAATRELVAYLNHENGWWRDTAQRLIVQRQPKDPATLASIRSVVKAGTDTGKLHALWTLHGLAATDAETVGLALADRNEWVRVHGLRVAPQILRDLSKLSVSRLRDFVQTGLSDPSFRVRLQAYQSLKDISDASFVAQAFAGAADLDWESPHLQETAVSVLSGHEIKFIEACRATVAPAYSSGLLAAIQKLSGALFVKRDEKTLQQILALAQNPDKLDKLERAMLSGIADSANRKGAKPIIVTSQPSLIEQLLNSGDPDTSSLAQRLQKAFRGADEAAEVSLRDLLSEEELAFAQRGEELYAQTCLACHGQDGRGRAGVAPALDGSPWVLDSKDRLALIVAQGLAGEIVVNGETWNGIMPGNAANPLLSGDNNLAAVLSYIRTAWSNEADIVRPAELEAALEPHRNRIDLWTPAELEQLFGPVESE